MVVIFVCFEHCKSPAKEQPDKIFAPTIDKTFKRSEQ